MSPESGMASAMFSVLILPPLLFVGTLVGGIIAGFVVHRLFGHKPALAKVNRSLLGVICLFALAISLGAFITMPPLGELFPVATYLKAFVTCGLVAFWSVSGK